MNEAFSVKLQTEKLCFCLRWKLNNQFNFCNIASKKCIVKWGKKRTIQTNLSFYEHQRLNIKIGFQAVKIYFLTFSSYFFTSYLQPIRNKLLKTSSVFYSTKWGNVCFSRKWPTLAAKSHTGQKIIHNSVKTYDILMK